MAKRITNEERILDYFMTAIENEAVSMAEKVVLIVRTRFGSSNPKMGPLLAVKQPRKPRTTTKLKEPEAQRELRP